MLEGQGTGVALGDVLAYRGSLAGPGGAGMYGAGLNYGNQTLAAEAHADGTAVKEAIDCNAKQNVAGMINIMDRFEDGRRADSTNRIADKITTLDRDVANNRTEVIQALADVKADAAKCCCDMKILIKDNTIDALKSDLAKCQNDSQTTILANLINNQNQTMAQMTAMLATIVQCGGCKFPGGGPSQ